MHVSEVVAEHNAKESSYKLACNEFCDWTEAELEKLRSPLPPMPTAEMTKKEAPINPKKVAATIDWRAYNGVNYVSPIKNQGACGSCWSFTTIAACESEFKIKNAANYFTGTIPTVNSEGFLIFSEQQLIDCAKDPVAFGSYTYTNAGCNGGYLFATFDYLKQSYLTLDSVYPYAAADGTCTYTAAGSTGLLLSTYEYTYSQVALTIKALVEVKPIAVGIAAYSTAF